MTRYTVDRDEVTAATAKVDALLANGPGATSQLVYEGLRKLSVQPLTVFFDVREDDRLVEIVRVRRARALDDLS